ncbi:uncharacterized protein A4U43_C09F1630 [Asparagus officinalis]|uniref:Uncharacterized protein n=1 Tax=Asparagus officinalis TaxID=4686 RepID=A0A5P1E507_ASPOF|nr:uncharacterized protein A4U43_C09F1630 [Asparagus officinalis]
MSSVLLFVMWALVAAIPCQDRGLNAHFSMPRSFPWAVSISSMHERILEESRKRDRRKASGLLREMSCVEKCMRKLNELTDDVQSPMGEDKEREVREQVKELKEVCEALKEGLESLEMQVREVFHRIVRGRTEGLGCLNNNQE